MPKIIPCEYCGHGKSWHHDTKAGKGACFSPAINNPRCPHSCRKFVTPQQRVAVKRPYMRHPPCAVECRCDGNEKVYALIGDSTAALTGGPGGVIGFGDTLADALRSLATEIEKEVEVTTMPEVSHNQALTGPDASRRAKAQILPPPVPEGQMVDCEADVIRVWSLPDEHCNNCHEPHGLMSCVAVGDRIISVCCTVTKNFKRATGQP